MKAVQLRKIRLLKLNPNKQLFKGKLQTIYLYAFNVCTFPQAYIRLHYSPEIKALRNCDRTTKLHSDDKELFLQPALLKHRTTFFVAVVESLFSLTYSLSRLKTSMRQKSVDFK